MIRMPDNDDLKRRDRYGLGIVRIKTFFQFQVQAFEKNKLTSSSFWINFNWNGKSFLWGNSIVGC
jgi:hypothetical protein